MPPADKVPTNELGTVVNANLLPAFLGAGGSSILTPIDEQETVAAWIWPNSIHTAERMRNDAKLDALIEGLLSPLEQWRWGIERADATEETARRVAEDLGLPLVGEDGAEIKIADNDRYGSTFSHVDHLRHALLAVVYGFYYFEIVGEMRDGAARLVKLAARPPRTIQNVSVDEDGGLLWIQQMGFDPPKIPINRLCCFVWRKEAANWFGRSILRACYAPWVAKDRLVRDDLTRHRRNSTGMPILEMDENPTEAQRTAGEELVANFRSADKGGGLLPANWKLHLQGVEGGTSDPLGSIVYHDSQMAHRFQQMVSELGQTKSGNRALGETFEQLLQKAQEAVANWYRDVMQEHVIEDFCRWNDGPGASCPRLVYDPAPEPDLAVVEEAVKANVITMDDNIENAMRAKLKLPPIDPATVRHAPTGGAGIDPATGLPAAPFPARRRAAAGPGSPADGSRGSVAVPPNAGAA
jgi:hypothetical protein